MATGACKRVQVSPHWGRDRARKFVTVLLEVKEKSLRMMHEMRHDASGDVAATTEVVGVHIDATIRKATRLPEDVRTRAMQVREEEFALILGTL